MKILVITKRQYTGQDLIDDRFGRLREIPLELARRGHAVTGLCLSYAERREGITLDEDDGTGASVAWESVNAGPLVAPGLLRFYRRARSTVRSFEPDVIWACSDSLFGILGTRLARQLHTRCVFDIYDNFEYFGTVAIPGVRGRYRRAVSQAHGITCASRELETLLEETCGLRRPALVLENAVRKDLFFPRDKRSSRLSLGLPDDAKIIGVAGALSSSRGIEAVFDGFKQLAASDNRVHLALAGPRDKGLEIPTGASVHDFGMLPLDRVAELLTALDVAVIANRDSAFGRYCFPQKLNEILACGVPFVAANVGTMQSVLAARPEFLFAPDDAADFARAVLQQLEERYLPEREVPGWDDQAALAEGYFGDVISS